MSLKESSQLAASANTSSSVVSTAASPTEKAGAGLTVRTAVAGSHLFREQAIEAYMRGDREARMLRAEPAWTRQVFVAGALLVATLFLVAAFGRVDVTSQGLGILRVEGDVQFARTEIAGMVSEIHARSGDLVKAGQIIVTLKSTNLGGSVLEADRRLALAKTAQANFDARRSPLFERRRLLLVERVKILERRLQAEKGGLAHKGFRVHKQAALAKMGWTSKFEEHHAFEEMFDAKAQNLNTAEQTERARSELASLQLERDTERLGVKSQLDEAQAHRDAVALTVGQTTVRAANAGTLDSVLVRRGDAVQAGTTVARIVSGTAQQITAFVPERDRAFLEPGAAARVEMQQLPSAEFGALRATVVRVAKGIASSAEVKDVLGDQANLTESGYRVDLTLNETPRRILLGSYVRAGSLVNVRYVLRQCSLASLVFAPFLRGVESLR